MKKFILLTSFLLITRCAFCAPDQTMSISPAAVDATTIEASDENTRNNAISTTYNAHTHEDLTKTSSTTFLFGSGTSSGTNMTLKFGNSTNVPAIRWNGTLDAFQYTEDQSTWITLPMTQGTTNQYLVSLGAGQIPVWITRTLKGCRATLSGDQSMDGDDVWRLVTFNTETYDTNSEFDPGTSRVTIRDDGYYLVTACIKFTAAIADKLYHASIYKNGAAVNSSTTQSSSTGAINSNVMDVINASAGDYIEVYAAHTSATSKDIDHNYSFMAVSKLE